MTWPVAVFACVVAVSVAALVAWRWYLVQRDERMREEISSLDRRLEEVESAVSFRR